MRALAAGAAIVNDVSALRYDFALAGVVARSGAAVVLMHNRGRSSDMYREARYGDVVRARTPDGAPALDLRAGVAAALDAVGAVGPAEPAVACTASDTRYYSWRARKDTGRQTAAIWSSVIRSGDTSAHTR